MRNRVTYIAILSVLVFIFSSSVIGFATSCNNETLYSLKSVSTVTTESSTEETATETETVATTTTETTVETTAKTAETTVETTVDETETVMPTEETTVPTKKVTTTKPTSKTSGSSSKPSTTKPKTTNKAPTKKPTATKAPTKAPTKTPTKPAVKPKTTKTPTKAPTPVPSKGYAMVQFKFSVTMRDKDENGNYIKHSFTKNLKCVTTNYHSKKTSDYHLCDEDATLKAVKSEVGSNYRNYSASISKIVEFLN